MKKDDMIKAAGLAAAIVVVMVFVLFFLGQVAAGVFWIVIALAALLAYFVFPYLKKSK